MSKEELENRILFLEQSVAGMFDLFQEFSDACAFTNEKMREIETKAIAIFNISEISADD